MNPEQLVEVTEETIDDLIDMWTRAGKDGRGVRAAAARVVDALLDARTASKSALIPAARVTV